MNQLKKIYVLGAGAVGCFFGGTLSRAGLDVTLIARPDRALAINNFGLELGCKTFHDVIYLRASSDASLLVDADLVLLCVKSPDTEAVMHSIAPILPSHAIVLSMQNGVANVQIAQNCITNLVYPAVVYVAAGMDGQRTLRHHGRGELVIGSMDVIQDHDSKVLTSICQLFESAGIPCSMAEEIKKEMWLKLLVNCSYNGISAIGHISYGEMVLVQEVKDLINQITKEFLLIASKEGVHISEFEAKAVNESIAKTMATQVSSTAQDLAKGKKTEINYLNGYIVQLGKRYGIETPVNLAIYTMVKVLENQAQTSAIS